MATFTPKNLRNVCFLGHSGSGKTSLAEAMLYLSHTTERLGSPSQGNSVCDYDPEEIKRGFSVSAACCNFTFKGEKINIIDTPGFLDFVGEALSGLRVADAALITVDAKSGVEVGTELAWENATAAKLPKSFFINKSDDPDADFGKVFDALVEKFGQSVCPVLIPASTPAAFINLIDLKKYVYDDKGDHTEGEINPEYQPVVDHYREKLFEAIASTDEALMEKFFSGVELTRQECEDAILHGIVDGSITPVFSGSAVKLWGVETLMENIADSYPDVTSDPREGAVINGEETVTEMTEEGDCALFVFKTAVDQYGRQSYFRVMRGTLTPGITLRNARTGAEEKISHIYTMVGKKQTKVESLCCGDIGVVTKLAGTDTNDTLSVQGEIAYAPIAFPEPFLSMAVLPQSKGEEDKMALALNRLLDEDHTLSLENNPETKQIVLSGLGDMQLDITLSRLKSRNNISAKLIEPKIAYRETIRKKVQAEGKHKKQSGGHGQYGHVKITFSPGEADGLTFTTSVVGGSVPKGYFPAVEKGLQEAMRHGVLAGFPVVNLAADLYDGSYHDVDSNELSFKMAASLAYKAGLPNANPVLLEPVGELTITVPDGIVGDIMGDLNGKRRGSVLGMHPSPDKRGYTVIQAEAPKAEMTDYPIALRAMSQGKGSFIYRFARYDEVPGNIAQKIIAQAAKEQDD